MNMCHHQALTKGMIKNAPGIQQGFHSMDGGSDFAFDLEGVERVKGIEPSYDAWEAPALPLSYTRVSCLNMRL
jgi:hypothetical protein